jgi:quercetin dioxygenase-like cupin family protein
MRISSFLTVLILLSGASLLAADTPRDKREPRIGSIRELLRSAKSGNGAVPVRNFIQGEKATVNLVTPEAPIADHYHAKHEEIVYVLEGRGKLRLGDGTREVKEGDLVYIPIGCVHGFTPKGKDCRVLSIFAPAFDGHDRVFIQEN